MGTSTIEWTDLTWNPVTGCDKVSDGCTNCYALRLARRLKAMEAGRIAQGLLTAEQAKYQADGDPKTSGPGFGVTTHRDVLTDPLRWSRPRKVFVNSMGDLFHDQVPDAFVAAVFAVMALTSQHTYQLLTKRHARMRSLLRNGPRWRELLRTALADLVEVDLPIPAHRFTDARRWIHGTGIEQSPVAPLPNVWLGVSAEDQATANLRVPALLETPAAVRFVSAEPLLGPVDLTALQRRPGGALIDALSGDVRDHDGTIYAAAPGCLDWVIAGGESGTGASPMHPNWARKLRDDTTGAGRAFLFKQWGAWAPAGLGIGLFRSPEQLIGPPLDELGHRQIVRRVGKSRAGRQLDGRTWDEYPAVTR